MKGRFQSSVRVRINAPWERVWEILDDITLIPQYHPEVREVDLVSSQKKRAAGVKYQCHITEGRKGNCVEEVVEYIPHQKFSTAMPEDSWGISKMFSDFIVDTTITPHAESTTILQFDSYYNPIGLWNSILNLLILRRAFKKKSMSVMEGIKRLAEKR